MAALSALQFCKAVAESLGVAATAGFCRVSFDVEWLAVMGGKLLFH